MQYSVINALYEKHEGCSRKRKNRLIVCDLKCTFFYVRFFLTLRSILSQVVKNGFPWIGLSLLFHPGS